MITVEMKLLTTRLLKQKEVGYLPARCDREETTHTMNENESQDEDTPK